MPAPAILEVAVRPPKRDAESDVRKTARSNGECWVATWSFRFANLKHERSRVRGRRSGYNCNLVFRD
jgi:hypothetical protein